MGVSGQLDCVQLGDDVEVEPAMSTSVTFKERCERSRVLAFRALWHKIRCYLRTAISMTYFQKPKLPNHQWPLLPGGTFVVGSNPSVTHILESMPKAAFE